MLRFALVVLLALGISGCNPFHSRLTGYNLKASVGRTDYQNGDSSFFSGGSIDAHFEVDQASR